MKGKLFMMDPVITLIPAATVADRGDGRRDGQPRRRGGAAVSARSGTSTCVAESRLHGRTFCDRVSGDLVQKSSLSGKMVISPLRALRRLLSASRIMRELARRSENPKVRMKSLFGPGSCQVLRSDVE